MILNSWNKIWKNKTYWVENEPSNNIYYFYNYHLKNLKKGSKILDCGCGNGRNFNFLNKKGFDVYGTDISKSIILKNKKRFKKNQSKFFIGDIKEINFKKNFFESIVSDASIYYQSKNRIFETIEEFYRILKKKGTIRVYTKSIYDNYYFDHKRRKSFEHVVKNKHWENGLLITFLNKNDIIKIFKKFTRVQIGIESFNYINEKRKHSYWIITATK